MHFQNVGQPFSLHVEIVAPAVKREREREEYFKMKTAAVSAIGIQAPTY